MVLLAKPTTPACGNTYQDAIVQYRTAHQEKATSLDLCHVEGVGYVAEHLSVMRSLVAAEFTTISESEFLALLEYYCDPDLALSSTAHSQVAVGAHTPQSLKAQSPTSIPPPYFHRPLYRNLLQASAQCYDKETTVEAIGIAPLLRSAKTLVEVIQIVTDSILGKLSRALAIEKENINANLPISAYGIDSLSAIELRTWFSKEIGVTLSVFDILGSESVAALSQRISGKSQYVTVAVGDGNGKP